MKRFGLLLLLLKSIALLGQQVEFGELTDLESGFRTYEKDTITHAVYLYEKGENYFEVRRDYVWLIKNTTPKLKF